MNNLFLTGKIGVGKTTLLKKVLKRIDLSVGGYTTEKNIQNDTKTFTIKSLYDGTENHTMAHVNKSNYSKKIFTKTFDTYLPSIIQRSFENRDLIVLDEIGFMEDQIHVFTSKIYEILDSDKFVFGVIKDYDCEFLNKIRNRTDVTIIEITEDNRNHIINDIMEILKSFNIPLKNLS